MSAAEALKAARGRCRKPQAAGSRFSVNVGLLDGPLEPASKKSRIGGSFLPAPTESQPPHKGGRTLLFQRPHGATLQA